MNEELFNTHEALTFDDLLIVPNFADFLPSQSDLKTDLAAGLSLNIPLLSAAMDTVTEARLAIALAREGGLGIIHRNMSPEMQANEVEKVKRSESGMITDPVTLPPSATLGEADQIMGRFHISGVPVVDPQTKKLLGILTNRDIRFTEPSDSGRPVSEFMTSKGLVTAPINTTLMQAKKILQEHRIEKLPLVDEAGRIKGLITVKDIQKKTDYPNAATDPQGRLLVGAAVGVGDDIEQRVELMLAKGLDAICIDTSHGHTAGVIRAIERIKSNWKNLPLIAGNVVTAEGTAALIKAGVDVVKVGIGAGSICTTRIISGAGMPQMSAIFACASEARKKHIPVIADGGIKFSGDIVKAIAAGANAVMLGSLMAGLEEAPGDLILYNGRQFKNYRGMGSMAAMQGYGRDRYGSGQGKPGKLVPEGVEGMVPYKGTLSDFVYQLVGGLRSGMGYAGTRTLEDLRTQTRLVRISNAGLTESHSHDVTITREAPNYQRGES
ncbi:MAG: IMP dehydrogenase [Anaerolineae bacterium]|nr:IMP dehydrogenase [Anaerolineae bacterium]